MDCRQNGAVSAFARFEECASAIKELHDALSQNERQRVRDQMSTEGGVWNCFQGSDCFPGSPPFIRRCGRNPIPFADDIITGLYHFRRSLPFRFLTYLGLLEVL